MEESTLSRLRVDVLSTEARIFQKKKIEEGDSKKKKRFITLLEVFNLPLNIYLATEQKKKNGLVYWVRSNAKPLVFFYV